MTAFGTITAALALALASRVAADDGAACPAPTPSANSTTPPQATPTQQLKACPKPYDYAPGSCLALIGDYHQKVTAYGPHPDDSELGEPFIHQPNPWGLKDWYYMEPYNQLFSEYSFVTFWPVGLEGSDEPKNSSDLHVYTTDFAADQWPHILEFLDIKSAHVLGHCESAKNALEFAERHPDSVASLTLTNACVADVDISHLGDYVQAHMNDPAYAQLLEAGQIATSYNLSDPAFKNDSTITAEVVLGNGIYFDDINNAPLLNKYFYEGGEDAIDLSAWVAYPQGEAAFPLQTSKKFCRIKAPTLIIDGTNDVFCPGEVATMINQGIKGSEYHPMNSNHIPWLDPKAVDEYTKVVRSFWQSLEDDGDDDDQ